MKFVSRVALLSVAYGSVALANLLLSVVLGRGEGASALGAFALAVSVSRIYYSCTDLGISVHVTRAVVRDHERGPAIAAIALAFRLALIPLAIVVTCSAGLLQHEGNLALFALVPVAHGLGMLNAVYEALFLARHWQRTVALLTLFASVLIASGAGLWLLADGGSNAFGAQYAAATLVATMVWMFIAQRKVGSAPMASLSFDGLGAILRRSWPMGMTSLLMTIAQKSPIIILGSFCTRTELGAFVAADMLVMSTTIIQTAVTSSSFPSLAASHATDREAFTHGVRNSSLLLLLVGAIASGVFLFAAEHFIRVLFPGRDFAIASGLLRIIGCSVPLLLLSHHLLLILAAADRERLSLLLLTIWLSLIVGATALLTGMRGVNGAAEGLLIGRILGFAVIAFTVRGTVSNPKSSA